MNMDKLYKGFVDPDVSYRPAPFWIWNEEMDSKETVRQLDEMKKHGFGGGFAHVRMGLITPYLQDDFFKAFGETLEGAKKLGVKLYMYDEAGWPSGFAGGYVMESCPETISVRAKYHIINAKGAKKTKEFIAAYAYDEQTNTVKERLNDIPEEKWQDYSDKIIYVEKTYPVFEQWCGGFPFVDLTNPKVTEKFIEVTHEEYAKRFGADFGDCIPAIFSDESSVDGMGRDHFVYTDVICKKFYEMHGYKLEDNILAVYEDFNGEFDRPAAKVRYDYNCTISELWINSFVKPISKWCADHKIAWTGHDQEHSWPQTRGGAFSEQRTYEHRQWPGIDMLLCDAIAKEPSWNDTLLMHEARSAANQFNKEKVICEIYGAAGWHSTFRDYKRIGDWCMVNGINFFIQHLTHYSIVGLRKRDCPQSFDWRQPWWDEYTEYNDYFSRISYLLSQGKMEQRILVLNTTTTAYMIPISKQDGMINHTCEKNCIKNPDMTDMLTVMQMLIDEQWDFDIGDEFSIGDNAVINGNKFTLGSESYDVIIISKNMKNMRGKTAELVKKFAQNGGKVISTGDAAEYIDGDVNEKVTSELRNLWTVVKGADGVKAELDGTLEKRIEADKSWPTGVAHMRRKLDDGREVYFFVNHSMKPFEANVTLNGDSIVKWDLFTGEKVGYPCKLKDGKLTFELSLEYCQSAMFVVGDSAEFKREKPVADVEVKLEQVSIMPEKYNDLLVDHCKLKADGETTEERHYHEAQNGIFAKRGFRGNPWVDGPQFRSQWLDKNPSYGPESGFEVIYNFTVKDGALPSEMYAVVERPEIMNVRVNGTELKWNGETHYLDYKMGKFDISNYVKEGNNEIVLWANKFDVREEIEALIIEGEFGVEVENDRFVIAKKPEMFTNGSWCEQGYKFYPNAFVYKYKADLNEKPETVKLVMQSYSATAISARVNGKYAGIVGKDGDEYIDISDYVQKGENDIELRVCGSFRSLYGPHFNYIDQTVAAGEDFLKYARGRVNYASEYQLPDYGIFEMPKLLRSK